MGPISGIVVFLIIWWTVLFAVLPLRVERQENPQEGLDRGAPKNPHLKFKFWLTTGITLALWLVYYTLVVTGVLTHEIFV